MAIRRLKSANPRSKVSPGNSLNSTLPLRSSLFDFECVATDLYTLLQDADAAKAAVLEEGKKERIAWKLRCRNLREKEERLMQKNTELRNQLEVRRRVVTLDEYDEEEWKLATQCVRVMQLGTLKYMNQEFQTTIAELKDAVETDSFPYDI